MATQLARRKNVIIQTYLEMQRSIEIDAAHHLFEIDNLYNEQVNLKVLDPVGNEMVKRSDIHELFETGRTHDLEFNYWVENNYTLNLEEKD